MGVERRNDSFLDLKEIQYEERRELETRDVSKFKTSVRFSAE